MKSGEFADRTINHIGKLGLSQRVDIRLHGAKQLSWSLRILAKDSLAANHHQLLRWCAAAAVNQYGGARAQQMLQLFARHRKASKILARSSDVRNFVKGED